jgi:hypothetical protein
MYTRKGIRFHFREPINANHSISPPHIGFAASRQTFLTPWRRPRQVFLRKAKQINPRAIKITTYKSPANIAFFLCHLTPAFARKNEH